MSTPLVCGRYAQRHWFPTYKCPRHGVCWSDLFYPFSTLRDQRKTLAVALALCVFVVAAGCAVYVASYSPTFTKSL